MGFFPFVPQSVPVTGGTFTGPVTVAGGALTVSGAFPAGGMINVTNTTAAPTSPDVIITSAAAGDKTLGIQVSGDTAPRTQFLSTALQFGNGAGVFDAVLNRPSAALIGQPSGSFDVSTAGQGLRVAEGSNAKQGLTAAMTAGTITVANTATTANSRILLTSQATGGTVGGENVSARTAGTSFTITSTNAADTSQVAFQMFEPG